MKINEVESIVGITKKNIRFYESEGLLSPRRNSENGYRDYGEEEVSALQQIKLMRKLGVSLEEIRKMQSRAHTVGDGIRRHLITLERERSNLEQSIRLCGRLRECDAPLADLDAAALLEEMEHLERSGASFQDKQRSDIRARYVAPVAIALGTLLLLGGITLLLGWIFFMAGSERPPLPLAAALMSLPLLLMGGVVLALSERIREIGKGEIDDAKNY